MAYVSILVPFVIAYIFYAWRSIDKKKIDAEEMDEGGHAYWVDSYLIDSGQLTIDSVLRYGAMHFPRLKGYPLSEGDGLCTPAA